MPELLDTLPKEDVSTQITRAPLSAGQVAQPYNDLARALDKTGEGLGDLAVPMAERQGAKDAQAITRDAQGNIVVAPQPAIFGEAGFAYTRALKMGALAQADGDAKRADLELRQQFRDNPGAYDAAGNPTGGYLAASDAYRKKTVEQYSDALGPAVGGAIGQAIESTTTQTYRGLLNEKERLDLQRADGSMTARMTSARDDAMALARQGIGMDNPAMKQALDAYTGTLDERANNPRLAYSKDQRDLDVQTFQSDLAANKYLHGINETYKSGGAQAAERDAQDILSNPDYKLAPEMRDRFYHEAIGEVRANEAIRHQSVGEARAAWSELKMSSVQGEQIDPEAVDSAINAFKAAGDLAGAASAGAYASHMKLNDSFGRQPLTDQVDQLRGLTGGARGQNPGNIVDGAWARSQPGYVGANGRFAAFDTLENGAQAMAANLRSYAAQGIGTLNQLTAKWAPKGDGNNDPAAYAARIGAATGIDPDASIDLKDPAVAAKIIPVMASVEQGHPVAGLTGGAPSSSTPTPASSAWLQKNRELELNKNLWDGWKTVMKDYNETHTQPTNDAVDTIMTGARQAGNGSLLSQIAHDMSRVSYAQTEAQKPLGQQQADITKMDGMAQSGRLQPGQADLLKDLQARYGSIAKGLEDDPVKTTATNFADKLPAPGPLDFSDPQKMIPGLADRAKIVQVGANNWQTGPLSVLDKQDVLQFKAALANPDPAHKAGLYGAIATLPDGIRGATLRKIGGNEPAGMAEAAAGSMMADAPAVGMSIFRGQAAMKADKRYDPETENEGKASYLADLDRALPASTFTLQDRTDPAGAYATMATMVKARYADLSAQSGQTTYSKDRVNQAVTDVTGGILSHNGGSFIAPARGMDQSTFDGILRGVTDNDLAGVRTLGGQSITADYLRGNGQLESAGDGRYFVKLGRDPLKPIYAYGPAQAPPQGNGQFSKFILDLRNRSAGPSAPFVPTDNGFMGGG